MLQDNEVMSKKSRQVHQNHQYGILVGGTSREEAHKQSSHRLFMLTLFIEHEEVGLVDIYGLQLIIGLDMAKIQTTA